MDDIVRDVNEGWDQQDPTRPTGMQYVSLPSASLIIYH